MTNNFMLFVTVAANVLVVAVASAFVGGVSGARTIGIGVAAAALNVLLNKVLVVK